MRQTIVEKLQLTGFIADYMKYAQSLTDAPVEFHLGAGLTALATACGSHVIYASFGGRRAWPNLYTLLIAPSGLYRKSTSVGIAEDLIADCNPGLILSGEQSREKFLSVLKDNPNVLYPISEFSAVLAMWGRDYSAGFKEIIVDLYDNRREYSRQTMGGGKTTIKEPSLNILAASTVDWLREKLTDSDLRGGLIGRFLLLPGVNKGNEVGLNINIDTALKTRLVGFLRSINTMPQGWVDMREVLPDFNKWVHDTELRIEKDPNPSLVGFQSRVGAHALKLAVLFTISECGPRPKYMMTTTNLAKAFTLAGWLLDQASEMAETGFIKAPFEQEAQKLIALSKRNGGVTRWDAMRLLHTDKRKFDNLVSSLVERKEIIVVREGTKTKTKTVYQWNTNDKSL